MAYWLTEQDPFVLHRKRDSGIWVRPGKEIAARELQIGDYVFIYEVFRSRDTGETGGAKAVLLLVQVTQRIHKDYELWIKVARAKPIAEGLCPHHDLLRIIGYKRIQSMGPLNSKILNLNDEQFDQIADYFPNYLNINQLAGDASINTYLEIRGKHGQGFADQQTRKAIERHSMAKAMEYFTNLGYSVEDHSKLKPYDLFCNNNGEKYYVEVKGTQNIGDEIFLTTNEVRWANRYYKHMILFILHSIDVKRTSSGLKTKGGSIKVIERWKPKKDKLFPLSFKYHVTE